MQAGSLRPSDSVVRPCHQRAGGTDEHTYRVELNQNESDELKGLRGVCPLKGGISATSGIRGRGCLAKGNLSWLLTLHFFISATMASAWELPKEITYYGC
jgi:hypothetical protein